MKPGVSPGRGLMSGGLTAGATLAGRTAGRLAGAAPRLSAASDIRFTANNGMMMIAFMDMRFFCYRLIESPYGMACRPGPRRAGPAMIPIWKLTSFS